MSIKAMNWAWGQALSPTPKLILMALADAADDEGLCWPGIRTLAAKCGVSGRTVQRMIKAFVSQGLLVVEERRRPSGRQTSNSYHLVMESYPDKLSSPTLSVRGGGDTGSTPRVTQMSQGEGDSVVSLQEPPREHVIKPPLPGENGGAAIVFPRKLTILERQSIISMAGAMPIEDLQLLVDELASALASENTIRTTPLRWFQGILRRYRKGEFVAAGAIEIEKRRLKKQQEKSSEAIQNGSTSKAKAEPYIQNMRQVLGGSKKRR
jgi:DNA-binding transcriptional regulator YhcF (GntR family)